MAWNNLKGSLGSTIFPNTTKQIDAQTHQDFEEELIDAIGALQYRGIVIPTDNLGYIDGTAWVLAKTAGTYANFSGQVLVAGDVAFLKFNGTTWTKDLLFNTTTLGAVSSIADTATIDLNLATGVLTGNVKLDGAANNDITATGTGLFLNVQNAEVDDNENLLGGGVGADTPLINLLDEIASRLVAPGAWTKTGTVVHLTTLTDYVSIGTNTTLYPLQVKTSNAVQANFSNLAGDRTVEIRPETIVFTRAGLNYVVAGTVGGSLTLGAGGTTASHLEILGTGQINFKNYTTQVFTGTPSTFPAFTSAGVVIQRTAAQLLSDIGAGAGSVTAANNGLSLSSTTVQLGHAASGTGASDFTANRFLYTGNFDLETRGTGGYMYFDGSTGRFAIGNTAPSEAAHITGNIRVTGAYYDSANSAGTNTWLLSTTGTGTAWVNPSTIGNTFWSRTGTVIHPTTITDSVAIGQTTATHVFDILKAQNANSAIRLVNNDAGAAAGAQLILQSDAGTALNIFQFGSGRTASGLFQPNRALIYNSGSGGYILGASHASGVFELFAGGLSTSNVFLSGNNAGYLAIGRPVRTGTYTAVLSVIPPTGLATSARLFEVKSSSGSPFGDRAVLLESGKFTLGLYGVGTFTGTPAYFLAATSGGDVIERTAAQVLSDIGAASALTFSNGLTNTTGTVRLGGTLTQDTTLTGNGNDFEVNMSSGGTALATIWSPSGLVQDFTAVSGQKTSKSETTTTMFWEALLPSTHKSNITLVNGSVQFFTDNLTNSNQTSFNIFSTGVQFETTNGTGTAGITTTPTEVSHNAITGRVKINGTENSRRAVKSANYTVVPGDNMVIASVTGLTFTLPASGSRTNGDTYHFGVTTGTLTVDGDGADLVGTTTTVTVNAGSFITVKWDDTYGGWLLGA
jgi:hypothetical protein